MHNRNLSELDACRILVKSRKIPPIIVQNSGFCVLPFGYDMAERKIPRKAKNDITKVSYNTELWLMADVLRDTLLPTLISRRPAATAVIRSLAMPSPKCPRGSEWRKWDLQVHTPYSALNNGFGTDFEGYAKSLFRPAVEKGIAAIGITDYFSIDGYKQLRTLVRDRGKLETLVGRDAATKAYEILLLPNIEFRTSVIIARSGGKDSRVNFHVIFSDDIAPDIIEDHFLRELKFTAESNPGASDERWSLTSA
ncbi:MAG: hypothetical protein ACREQO_04745, partial [Candidatus Binatia bacterium]